MKNHAAHGTFASVLRLPLTAVWKIAKTGATALVSLFAIRPFASRNRRIRNLVFNALRKSRKVDFVYCNSRYENFIVNCRDQVISRGIFTDGEFEFDKFTLTCQLLRGRGLVRDRFDLLIDVGANIGSVCIPAVARGYAARAVAIEPHPLNCRLLRANVALNGLDASIDVHELAAGKQDGQKLELEVSDDNWGDHRISIANVKGKFGELQRAKISVPSTTLDCLVRANDQETMLLWMDIQGYEGFALKGAQTFIAARTPLVLEFWPYAMKRVGSYDFLNETISGYRGFYDLAAPHTFYSIGRLEEIYQALMREDGSTDILVI